MVPICWNEVDEVDDKKQLEKIQEVIGRQQQVISCEKLALDVFPFRQVQMPVNVVISNIGGIGVVISHYAYVWSTDGPSKIHSVSGGTQSIRLSCWPS